MNEQKITGKSQGITVELPNGAYYEGTWSVIGTEKINGKDLFLLEHEEHGDEHPALIVDEDVNVFMENVWNGFDDFEEQKEDLVEWKHYNEHSLWLENDTMTIELTQKAKLPYGMSFVGNGDTVYDVYMGNVNGEEQIILRTADGNYLVSPQLTIDYLNEAANLTDNLDDYIHEQVAAEKDFDGKKSHANYRQQVNYIYNYELFNNIPENDKMTKWYDEENISVAKPWYKEKDPSVMDRAEGSQRIGISEALIKERYEEILSMELQEKIVQEDTHREETKENEEELPFPEVEQKKGNEEYYKIFYAGEQNKAAEDFQKEKGWNKVYLTSSQGVTFDSWVIYRSVEDLPKTMQEPVRKLEQNKAAEEKAAAAPEKMTAKDQVLQQLKDGIKDVLDSERFADWCKKQGRLYYNHYSISNAILTYLQKPDASYVCGYETWKNYGRQVKQGAVGIKILAPAFARDYAGKGSLFVAIKKSCTDQLKKDATKEFATYRLGQSNLTFNMYKNGLFDVKVNDKVIMAHITAEETRKFIDRSVIGKVPTYYNVVTVFDISDTTDEVEFLWVDKDSCKKSEMVLDDKGEPITNKKGQVKIQNSEERKAKFTVKIDMELDENETDKMQILYDSLQKISKDKNIPVMESNKTRDDTLSGGALGYFAHPNAEYPQGRIVIDENLTITNKVAVLFHEIAHSDLHVDIPKLQEELGGDIEVTRQMKEVQAEAVAYMTASTFGIETQHKSFEYIANWSDGRELKALESSLDVIYKESQRLLKEIEKELDSQGLDMTLEPKDQTPLKEEDKAKIVCEYKEYALNNLRSNEELQKAAISEFKQLENEEVSVILKEQISLAKQIDEKLNALSQKAEMLENSSDRAEQLKLEYQLKAEKAQIVTLQHKIEDLSAERVSLVAEQSKQDKADMKALFLTDPMKAMEQLRQEVPQMKDLTDNDLKYMATSHVVAMEYSRFLGSNNEKFAELSIKQLDNLKTVMSKHNTAVEVEFCEQWSDKPIFEKGTVAHPRAANKIITDAEKESRALKSKAEAEGEYYPYSKCSLTVYTVSDDNTLSAFHTRVDIGDGEQKSLSDHLAQICDGKDKEKQAILDNFKSSVKERGEAKVLTPQREEIESRSATAPEKQESIKPVENQQDYRGMNAWKGMLDKSTPGKDSEKQEPQKEQEKE